MSLRSPLPPNRAGPIHFIGAREAMNSYDTCRTVEIQTVIVEVPARKRANWSTLPNTKQIFHAAKYRVNKPLSLRVWRTEGFNEIGTLDASWIWVEGPRFGMKAKPTKAEIKAAAGATASGPFPATADYQHAAALEQSSLEMQGELVCLRFFW